MEAYEGVVILGNNLRENRDSAFEQRIRFIVENRSSDAASREYRRRIARASEAIGESGGRKVARD
jgi:hypothetical protein